MKIEVKQVRTRGANLEITFKGGGNWATTPEGIRALRIVRMHVNAGYAIKNAVMTVGDGARIGDLNTLERCQATMDRYANMQIMFRNTDPVVYSAHGEDILTTRDQVRAAQKLGLVQASMRVSATLPILFRDMKQIANKLGARVYQPVGRLYQLAIVVDLDGDRRDDDPGKLLRSFLPTVYEVIK